MTLKNFFNLFRRKEIPVPVPLERKVLIEKLNYVRLPDSLSVDINTQLQFRSTDKGVYQYQFREYASAFKYKGELYTYKIVSDFKWYSNKGILYEVNYVVTGKLETK